MYATRKIGFCKVVFENKHGAGKLFSKSCGVAYDSQLRYKMCKISEIANRIIEVYRQSWTKVLRQFSQNNAFEQTIEFCI